MSTVQCENKHFYDDRKHLRCPYCPAVEAARMPKTEAANLPPKPRGDAAAPRVADRNLTVGVFRKQLGLDPVVGWLVCTDGVNKGRDYRLHSDNNRVGRDTDMDVCIEGDDTVSRDVHCVISYIPRSNSFKISPGENRNILYVNGEDVLGAVALKPYDMIEIGEGKFLFQCFCSDRFSWKGAGETKAPPEQPLPPESEAPGDDVDKKFTIG